MGANGLIFSDNDQPFWINLQADGTARKTGGKRCTGCVQTLSNTLETHGCYALKSRQRQAAGRSAQASLPSKHRQLNQEIPGALSRTKGR